MEQKRYKIAIVSDASSWIAPYVDVLAERFRGLGAEVACLHAFDCAHAYDFVFLLSYSRIVPAEALALNRHNLVVHESALPQGKGWSPLTWQVLEGRDEIPITLFEAAAAVDAGRIYLQRTMHFDGTELVDDLRRVQGEATAALCLEFVERYPAILAEAREQAGAETFYPRRHPEDSRLDLDKTLREQVNLLRVVDNERYPAFFEWKGQRYRLAVTRMDDAPLEMSITDGHSHAEGVQNNDALRVAVCGSVAVRRAEALAIRVVIVARRADAFAIRRADAAEQVAA